MRHPAMLSVLIENALQFHRVARARQREGQQDSGLLRIEIVRRDRACLMIVAADENPAFPHTGGPDDGDALRHEGGGQDMAAKAREEADALKERLAALEAKVFGHVAPEVPAKD